MKNIILWDFFNKLPTIYLNLFLIVLISILVTCIVVLCIFKYITLNLLFISFFSYGGFLLLPPSDSANITLIKTSWIILLSYFFITILLSNFKNKHLIKKGSTQRLGLFVKECINIVKKIGRYKVILLCLIICILILIIFRSVSQYFVHEFVLHTPNFLSILYVKVLLSPIYIYMFNILTKYFLMRNLENKDLKLYNDNVINSTNIYTIILIIILTYVALDMNIFSFLAIGKIFASISFLCGSLISSESLSLLYIVGHTLYEDLYKLSSRGLPFLSRDLDKLSSRGLSFLPRDFTDILANQKPILIGDTANYPYHDGLHLRRINPNLVLYNERIKSSTVSRAICDYEIANNRPFLLHSIHLSASPKFTIASALHIKPGNTAVLVLAVNPHDNNNTVPELTNHSYNIKPEHIEFFINHIRNYLNISLNNFNLPISEITLLAPVNLSFGAKSSDLNNGRSQTFTFATPRSNWRAIMGEIMPNKVTSHTSSLGYALQNLYTDSSDKLHILREVEKNSLEYGIEFDKEALSYNSSQFCIHAGYSSDKALIHITRESCNTFPYLPFMPTSMTSELDVQENVKVLDGFGLDMPSNIKSILMFTQVSPIEIPDNDLSKMLYKVWRISPHYNTEPTTSPYPLSSYPLQANILKINPYFRVNSNIDLTNKLMNLLLLNGSADLTVANNIGGKLLVDSFLRSIFEDENFSKFFPHHTSVKTTNIPIPGYNPEFCSSHIVNFSRRNNFGSIGIFALHNNMVNINENIQSETRINMHEWVKTNIQSTKINTVLQDNFAFELFQTERSIIRDEPDKLYSIVAWNTRLFCMQDHYPDYRFYNQIFNILDTKDHQILVMYFNQHFYLNSNKSLQYPLILD